MRFIIAFVGLLAVASAFVPVKRVSVLDMLQNNGDVCHTCQDFVTTLKSAVSNPTVMSNITNTLTEFCSKLTEPGQQLWCTSVVTIYAPLLLDKIFDRITPESVCQNTFKLCDPNREYCPDPGHTVPISAAAVLADQTITLPPAEMNDIECAACNWGVIFVSAGLMSPSAGNALAWSIDQFCANYISDPSKLAQCQNIAEEIGELLPFLQTILKPTTVCGPGGFLKTFNLNCAPPQP